MNVLAWVLQVVLASVFVAHGGLFLAPSAEVAAQMNASLPRWFSLFLGVAEVAAAAGLIVPALLRIKPGSVALAAAGLLPIMAGATVMHASRGEGPEAITTALLLALLVTVGYLRWKVVPMAARA